MEEENEESKTQEIFHNFVSNCLKKKKRGENVEIKKKERGRGENRKRAKLDRVKT